MNLRWTTSLILAYFQIFLCGVVPQQEMVEKMATVNLRHCCYGDQIIDQGTVVFSHPERCFQLVCQSGHIIPKYIQNDGDANCCEFSDTLYPDGSELAGHCMLLKCQQGSWQTTGQIEDCCNHCYLYDDPHISTFDGVKYDWHGHCNYSTAQRYFNTKPDIGIFSDFSLCNGMASCLSHTTFRNDPHTIVSLDNGAVSQLVVNGQEYTANENVEQIRFGPKKHPVLTWKYENCVFVLGSSNLLLLHCPHRLDIWAHPFHNGKLNGLCGHYSHRQKDDFIDRSGNVHELQHWPQEFPESWLTSDQADILCKLPCLNKKVVNPCNANQTQHEQYAELCTKNLQRLSDVNDYSQYIESCTFDLCLIYQSGGNDQDAENWIKKMEEIVEIGKKFP